MNTRFHSDKTQNTFENGIHHPEFWLWDSWTCTDVQGLHLYCLALSKTDASGAAITPPDRNKHQFHIRHFVSLDQGNSWTDHGPVLQPGQIADGSDARNVWSGSVFPQQDGSYLFGYTGVQQPSADRSFVQSISIGIASSANGPVTPPTQALSCPIRDYDSIRALGYYLGPKESLGDNVGEEGGPILSWRDPYIFEDETGHLNAVWSAKIGPTQPAIAQAQFVIEDGVCKITELFKPITLPDSEEFTQAEVPKIYRDEDTGDFYLLISACNRTFEGQPDSEVNQELRLYRAQSSRGPWQACSENGSLLADLNFLFGASIIDANFAKREVTLLGPYTENAGVEKQLTFEAPLIKKY